jgi:hypothetical protein
MNKFFENSNLTVDIINKVERFKKSDNTNILQVVSVLICIIGLTLWIYALYKAFHCISNGVGQFCDILAACCVPHLYILYRSARPCKPKNVNQTI